MNPVHEYGVCVVVVFRGRRRLHNTHGRVTTIPQNLEHALKGLKLEITGQLVKTDSRNVYYYYTDVFGIIFI